MRHAAYWMLLLAGCCVLLEPSVSAGETQSVSAAPRHGKAPGPILNRVVDMLDDEILLVGGDSDSVWESARLSTGRFNRIGLRASAADGSLPVRCGVCWMFETGDTCLDGVPFVFAPYPPPAPASNDGLPRPSGTPAMSVEFSEVRGLYARVRCSMPEIVFIGDDPDAPDEVTATLQDVKVLLRRE